MLNTVRKLKRVSVWMSHFSQLLEKDEVSLLELGRFLALKGPREAGASGPVGDHVALYQQFVVCNSI